MKNFGPLVSVIMPVYNSKKYIKDAINSIINQTYSNWELMLVIDCPTDGTERLIKCLEVDIRIRILYNHENKGIAYSRNRAIKESKGKYIALLDDDDIATPWRLQEQVRFLEKYERIGAVGGDYFYIDERGDVIDSVKEKVILESKRIRVNLLFRNVIMNGTMMIRRSVIIDNQLEYRDGMLGMEDFEFWIRLSKVTDIANIDKVLLEYRIHCENESANVLRYKGKEKAEMYARLQRMSLEKEGFDLPENIMQILKEDLSEIQPEKTQLEKYLRVCTFLEGLLKQALQNRCTLGNEMQYVVKKIIDFKCAQIDEETERDSFLRNDFYHLNRTDELKLLYKRDKEEYYRFCDELLMKYDVRYIKECFNLEYYVSDEGRKFKDSNIAVFVHLYYEDLLNECYKYLKCLAAKCDIYITSSNERLINRLQGYLTSNKQNNVYVSLIPNRGQDIAALLLYHSKKMIEYEYCCFLHDKKSMHLKIVDQGYDWYQMIWNSMLHSQGYVSNVIETFKQEPRLGILATPEPFWGTFAYDAGEAWGNTYDDVIRLASRLDLETIIRYESSPLTLGTAFWARTDAIMPLLKYEFEEDEFPEKGVGRLSYAVERILSYVAQSQRYYTGIIVDGDTARKRGNMLSKLNTLAFGWLKTHYEPCDLERLERENKKARLFTDIFSKYEHVHIYGAGVYAERFCKEFSPLFDRIEKVVVSDGHKTKSHFINHQVVEISNLDGRKANTAIIIAVSQKYINDVIKEISKHGFAGYVIYAP